MKWEKTYPTGYLHDGRIKYVHGEFSIMKTNDKNWETGRPMSDAYQVWQIRQNGEKVGYGYTLKEAKEVAEQMVTEREAELTKELGELREQVSKIWSHNVWSDDKIGVDAKTTDRIREIENLLGIEKVEPRKCRRPCVYRTR